jgi:hypothetical protein
LILNLLNEMESEILYQHDYALITLEPENKLLYLELIGEIGKDEYKDTFNTLSDKGVEIGIKRLMVNQATLTKSSMESKAWLITNWFPRMRKIFNDDVKIALILSPNLFTKIGGEYIIGAVRKLSKFDIKTFEDKDSAYKWLMND